MKLSQFAIASTPIQESHVESAELLQELKGLTRELDEILIKLTETSQFGHKVAQLADVDTSYFDDIKSTGEQLKEHINDLYQSIEKSGTDTDEVAEEEEEEVVGETPPEEE